MRQMHRHVLLFLFLTVAMLLPGALALWRIGHHTTPAVRWSVPLVRRLPIPAAQPTPVRALAFGDVMLDRFVATLMDRHGADYPFLGLTPLLQGQEIVFANLEGPIVRAYQQTPDDSLRFSFPTTVAPLLKAQGWTALSVANNHGFDHGNEGSATTRAALQDAGLDAVGHPTDIDRAFTTTNTYHGRTVTFLGFHATQFSFPREEALRLISDLAVQKDTFVIVSVHWGVEYQTRSNTFQQQLGRAFVDAGADLVLGHHPHVVQEVEIYRNRPIFYSLGNLIFDQYFSADTQQMLGVRFTIERSRVRYDLLPLASTKSQPRPMEADDAEQFLSGLTARSTWGEGTHTERVASFSLSWPDATK